MRPRHAPAFDKQDQIFCQRLVPHLQRAIQMHREFAALHGAKDAALAVLDRLPMGVLLLDRGGRALFSNQQARRIFARNDGLIVDRDGLCRAARSDESAILERLIDEAVRTGDGQVAGAGGAARVSRPSGLRPLTVLVGPLGQNRFDLGAATPVAAVFLSDPEDKPETPAGLLQRLYGLTAMEARLASALLAGATVKDAAAALEIAEGTAREYLKAIFRKTGTRRQSELMTLVLTGPAAFPGAPRP